jgi:hypothetical protein
VRHSTVYERALPVDELAMLPHQRALMTNGRAESFVVLRLQRGDASLMKLSERVSEDMQPLHQLLDSQMLGVMDTHRSSSPRSESLLWHIGISPDAFSAEAPNAVEPLS